MPRHDGLPIGRSLVFHTRRNHLRTGGQRSVYGFALRRSDDLDAVVLQKFWYRAGTDGPARFADLGGLRKKVRAFALLERRLETEPTM